MNYNNFADERKFGIYKPSKGSLLDSTTLDERLKQIKSGSGGFNSPFGITPDKYIGVKPPDRTKINIMPQPDNIIPDNNQQPVNAEILGSYAKQGAWVGNALGDVIALAYAFKTKSGFWKGFGYVLLGGLTGGALGFGVGSIIKKK